MDPDERHLRALVALADEGAFTAAGRGVSAVPDLIWSRVAHPGVVFRRIPGVPPSTVLAAWRPSGGIRADVERFVDTLADAASADDSAPPLS